MAKFSKRSLGNLASVDPRLVAIAEEVIKHFDFVVICGHRNKADQEKAYKGGFSKVRWPNSKHNKSPSLAIDCYPYPIPKSNKEWDDPAYMAKFYEMRKQFKIAAKKLGYTVKVFDWEMPHVQLEL